MSIPMSRSSIRRDIRPIPLYADPRYNGRLPTMFRKFRTDELCRYGYINYDPDPTIRPTVDPIFQSGGHSNSSTPILQIFKRGNFLATDDSLWTAIQPSLQIASRLILEPHMVPFYRSIIWGPYERIDDPLAENRLGLLNRYGHIQDQHRLAELDQWHTAEEVFKIIYQMKDMILWTWGEIDRGDYGWAEELNERPGDPENVPQGLRGR